MRKQYDNGSISAARSDQYLAQVGQRISDRMAGKQDSLEFLMSDFFEKVSLNRARSERLSFDRTGCIADEDGLPRKVGFFEAWKAHLKSLPRAIWEDFLARDLDQDASADKLARHIDAKIVSAGGSVASIGEKISEHARLKELDVSISKLHSAVDYIPTAVGFARATVPGKAAGLANGSNAVLAVEGAIACYEDTKNLLAKYPDFADRTPMVTLEHMGLMATFTVMTNPFSGERSQIVEKAKAMKGKLDELQESFNSWDVMKVYQEIWQDRAVVCRGVGLEAEAKACSEIADEYDSAYFEGIAKAWEGAKESQESENRETGPRL